MRLPRPPAPGGRPPEPGATAVEDAPPDPPPPGERAEEALLTDSRVLPRGAELAVEES
ncbi:hypothetical protein ACF09H_13615 [Streptomyces sp. NPDC014983]|uniref:hypothetical protein n=1 Tax=Streptomyces sp. NPDC014983 TaxID=3364933 RepID=UPI0036F8B2DF